MSNSSINEILWTKHELISASKGKDLTTKFLNNKKITGISIDTRSIEQNDLFIAIKGKNFDGHQFLEKAIQKGASGVIVSRKDSALKYNGLFVKNTHAALINFAEFSRNRFKGKQLVLLVQTEKQLQKTWQKLFLVNLVKLLPLQVIIII